MITADKKHYALTVLERLENTFPDAEIELNYQKDDPWQLLVVVALSAQTTDKKVNQISKQLFQRFPSVHDFACADPIEVEPYIKSIGLFRNKAKNLVAAAQKLIADFDGTVPKVRAQLETLPGVGKKTSAVIVSNAFHIPAIAVDTHVARVSRRLGLTRERDPDKIESDLTALFPRDKLLSAHHTIIFHGRRICFAKKPQCSLCPLADVCPRIDVSSSQ